MARGYRSTEQNELAHSNAALELMEAHAIDAYLRWPAPTWPREGTLEERLRECKFLMAPMASVTDQAYRIMAHAGGARLAYSEMVSVTGMHFDSQKTWELIDPNPAEDALAVQLFGSNVEHFKEAAPAIAERLGDKLALIDVNMACPVPKVTKSGSGSALLDTPKLAAEIVRALKAEVDVPVTIKMRIGRKPDAIVGPEFARAMEAAGADAIAVHGRVASQMYHGQSDSLAIKDVVSAVSVPVIASGDALSAQAAIDLLNTTGSAAVFIARGSYGNPWIFNCARRHLLGSGIGQPCVEMRLGAFALHVKLLGATGAHIARARSLAGWYLRGVPEAAAWRERAMHCMSIDDYLALIDELRSTLDDSILMPGSNAEANR